MVPSPEMIKAETDRCPGTEQRPGDPKRRHGRPGRLDDRRTDLLERRLDLGRVGQPGRRRPGRAVEQVARDEIDPDEDADDAAKHADGGAACYAADVVRPD